MYFLCLTCTSSASLDFKTICHVFLLVSLTFNVWLCTGAVLPVEVSWWSDEVCYDGIICSATLCSALVCDITL